MRQPTGSVEIGQRIRKARLAMKMSQAELAERTNLSSSQISQIERGKSDPRAQTLVHIVEALQISADSILRPNVPSVATIGKNEFDDLLSDCSPQEIESILTISRQLKETLRKNNTNE